jgi:hypothetical protein
MLTDRGHAPGTQSVVVNNEEEFVFERTNNLRELNLPNHGQLTVRAVDELKAVLPHCGLEQVFFFLDEEYVQPLVNMRDSESWFGTPSWTVGQRCRPADGEGSGGPVPCGCRLIAQLNPSWQYCSSLAERREVDLHVLDEQPQLDINALCQKNRERAFSIDGHRPLQKLLLAVLCYRGCDDSSALVGGSSDRRLHLQPDLTQLIASHLRLSNTCPRDEAGNPRFIARASDDWHDLRPDTFRTPTGYHISDQLACCLPEFEWHTGHSLQENADAANAAVAAWRATQSEEWNTKNMPAAKRPRAA